MSLRSRTAARIGAATAGLLALAATITAAPASANQYNDCNSQQRVCYYYSQYFAGAVAGFNDGDIPDLLLYSFRSGGSGSGTPVGNNSASVYNRWTNQTNTTYFTANFHDCPCHTFSPGRAGNLKDTLRNNNRSFRQTS